MADSLENSGKLEQLRAKVRAGIFDALERPQASIEGVHGHYLSWSKPHNPETSLFQETAVPLSRDNLVINELIREYLLFNGYRNTLSVLLPGADLAS